MSGAVLVVEDDRVLRELVRRYLQRAGHAVRSTASGAEAIELVTGGGVELVVLDLGLPDVDGREVLAVARAGSREVPVVVLTARSSVDDRIEGLRGGADDYVTKQLRRKLEPDGARIVETVLGVGYRLGWSRDR